ncbi:MAG TPA: pilin [Candidatus Dojkabacteria bacterium]|mgnify:FL=1|nr:pilin [Candidatus Dojkabacteria bacterium]
MNAFGKLLDSMNYTSFDNLTDFLSNIIQFAMTFSVIIAVIAVLVAGFKYITSAGDSEKVKSSTQSLIFALVGLVIVFLAPTLIKFILDKFI